MWYCNPPCLPQRECVPYYFETNPVGVGYARQALDEILAE
jgi:hypothetical protein